MNDRKPWIAHFGIVITLLLLLGIGFRAANLGAKVYWHDEVYTSLRAAGFTQQGIIQDLFQNRLIPASDLQQYQHIKPGSTIADTVRSLALEDPQHPPLYFVVARWWMQLFGSSLTASRSLPALISLLAFPLMYGLSRELFPSVTTALLATGLLALSPFDVLFAQTARQYSLLTVAILASHLCLLRAWRQPTWQRWGIYSVTVALGLYTHPFFALTLVGQFIYVLCRQSQEPRQKVASSRQLVPETGRTFGLFASQYSAVYLFMNATICAVSFLGRHTLLRLYALAIAFALLLYSPWVRVLWANSQRALSTTDWTRSPTEKLYLVKLWALSFTSLFLDLDFGFNNVWTYVLRLPIVLLIFASLYLVCRRTSAATSLFILTSVFVPFLILALPDVLIGGKRSAVSRYLISCYPGIQLAVAYWFSQKMFPPSFGIKFSQAKRQFWRVGFAFVITGSIVSCTVSMLADTWWNKDLSYPNAAIARLLNAMPSPVLVSDVGDNFTNVGDLISLSYRLQPHVKLFLLSSSPDLNAVPWQTTALVLRPSGKMFTTLPAGQLQLFYPEGSVWKLRRE